MLMKAYGCSNGVCQDKNVKMNFLSLHLDKTVYFISDL